MPRRRNPADARRNQVGVFVDEQHLRQWRDEAQARGLSLSRWVYIRATRTAPSPVKDIQVLVHAIGSIGRIGSVLNQLARLAWARGFDPSAFGEALVVTKELQRVLQSIAISRPSR